MALLQDRVGRAPLYVVVASTAPMKVAAVERLFAPPALPALLRPRGPAAGALGVRVEGVKTASGVNEQPFGHEETMRGALNRLAAARAARPGADFYVALENGLFDVLCSDSVGGGGAPQSFDMAWVVIEDSEGRRALAHSAGVEMPAAAAAASKASGFSTTAGGEVARAAGAGGDGADLVDPQDPHRHLTSGFCPREDMLLGALTVAWGQLSRLCSSNEPA
ncbi:unnamed protein product [Polarella glacialis]|uniref:inosine/xanthosine triphosphatase n=1 Tax=Polarella glacialis TaxID=89957 RepID=A0A813E3A3_POLGL|nr:unnamed protein product [Polarella glacialis]CAE8714765.1 unnamed protein product [Polarella glacialis]